MFQDAHLYPDEYICQLLLIGNPLDERLSDEDMTAISNAIVHSLAPYYDKEADIGRKRPLYIPSTEIDAYLFNSATLRLRLYPADHNAFTTLVQIFRRHFHADIS